MIFKQTEEQINHLKVINMAQEEQFNTSNERRDNEMIELKTKK